MGIWRETRTGVDNRRGGKFRNKKCRSHIDCGILCVDERRFSRDERLRHRQLAECCISSSCGTSFLRWLYTIFKSLNSNTTGDYAFSIP